MYHGYFASFSAFAVRNFEAPLSSPQTTVISGWNFAKSTAPMTDTKNMAKSLFVECSRTAFRHNATRRAAWSSFKSLWQFFTKYDKTGI